MQYLFTAIVLLAYCSAYCGAIMDTNKYCEIEKNVCNEKPHPMCNLYRVKQLPNDLENGTFYEMTAADINFIIHNINGMRMIIAQGGIDGYKSSANFRVVKWSDDYVLLAQMKLKYVGVCTKISLTDEYELETEQFRSEEEKWDRNFYKPLFSTRITNDSYYKWRWMPLFRAEFDTIGCALYHDLDGESNMLECLTNKASGKRMPYEIGKPCSQCLVECSKEWPNLCDELSTVSAPDEYNITAILIVSCITVALLFLAGMIFVFRLIINKNSEDRQHTDQTEMATEVLYSRGSEADENSQINYSHI